ncbi:MAG: SRPBCC family protein [Nitriliruptorales bacterium]|nr:SRPBCC family protein [Nitriliruptorales bacterium]
MIEVRSEVAIDRPADEVFAVLADAENNPSWQGGMERCEWVTEPPIREGSVYEQEARMMGKPITSTFEVIDLEPGRSITIRTIESTFPIEVTRSVEPRGDDSCVARAYVTGDPSGVFKLAAPVLRKMVERSVRADYRRLRRHLEGSGPTVR